MAKSPGYDLPVDSEVNKLDVYAQLKIARPEEKRAIVLKMIEGRQKLSLPALNEKGVPFSDNDYLNNPYFWFHLMVPSVNRADLSGADLSGMQLWHADLRGANLTNVTFCKTSLKFSKLRGANMDDSVFIKTNLESADLRRVRLSRAAFFKAYLDNTDLQFAEMQNCILDNVNLNDAKLQHASLRKAIFNEGQLNRSKFSNATLVKTDFSGLHLAYANFERANLQEAKFVNARLYRAEFPHAQLVAADLSQADLYQADLTNANLSMTKFVEANLQEAKFQDNRLSKADFQGANLCFSELLGVNFQNSTITNIHWKGAILEKTKFWQSQLGKEIGEEKDAKCETDIDKKITRYEDAKLAYLGLKQNFEELGYYDDAGWAYQKERQMKQSAIYYRGRKGWSEGRFFNPLKKFFISLLHQIVEWATGYGESPLRVIVSILILFIFGVVLFSQIGGLELNGTSVSESGNFDSEGYLILQRVLYMLDVFTTASFSDMRPVTFWAQFVSGCFALTGIFLTGLLGFVVGNWIRHS
ncbi:MAG: pentapeptide repeat-containing protein [Anaerolineae bacterium]|nr:pentapeptide repeat-containing protein [Anaerolineae bacterium]